MEKIGRKLRGFFSLSSNILPALSLSLLALVLLPAAINAQDDYTLPDDVEPPPLNVLSKEEQKQLSEESGVKDRTSLYIDLMTLRLKKAEEFTTKEDFTGALKEFGGYNGLLDQMVKFLSNEKKNGKVLNGFKKLEIVLRAHNFRIETVKRLMPFRFAFHITRLQKFIRKSRTTATESLFSDSVVPDADAKPN